MGNHGNNDEVFSESIESGVSRGIISGLIKYEWIVESWRLITLESILLGVIIGAIFSDFGIGVIAIVVSEILFFVPIIGTILSFLFCLVYGYLAYLFIQWTGSNWIVSLIVAGIVVIINMRRHIYRKY